MVKVLFQETLVGDLLSQKYGGKVVTNNLDF